MLGLLMRIDTKNVFYLRQIYIIRRQGLVGVIVSTLGCETYDCRVDSCPWPTFIKKIKTHYIFTSKLIENGGTQGVKPSTRSCSLIGALLWSYHELVCDSQPLLYITISKSGILILPG